MTRKEAIKEIEERVQITEQVGSSYVDCVDIEALRIAIFTLKQMEKAQHDELISREAEIDAVKRLSLGETEVTRLTMRIVDYLKRLPSAQPEQLERCPIYDGVCAYPSDHCYECPRHHGAQPEQRWIPWDSGRLPEESGTYIVTAYDGIIKRVTYAKYQKRLKRWELTGARPYWRVLAWMPLPDCYQGD